MILELIIALLIGILAGTMTGLFPGIHINLVAAGLLASVGYFSGIPVLALVVFVVAMAVTHTFIDFIPSIYLGAPEEDSFLAVLPFEPSKLDRTFLEPFHLVSPYKQFLSYQKKT